MISSLIYLCGPITGMPNGNRSLFEKAERWYLNRKHTIINPHDVASYLGDVPEHLIVKDELASITTLVDYIALLPGWKNSRYGMVEVAVGLACGIPFIRAFSFDPIHPRIKFMAYGSENYKELACLHSAPTPEANRGQEKQEKQYNLRQHLRTA